MKNKLSREMLDHIDWLFCQYPEHFKLKAHRECVILNCDEELICHASVKKTVCTECEGEGTELKGGLKGAVFTPEDFANDWEFEERYFGGAYDVPCSKCHGQRVLDIPDLSRTVDEELVKTIFEMLKDTHDAVLDAEADAAAERRWGC